MNIKEGDYVTHNDYTSGAYGKVIWVDSNISYLCSVDWLEGEWAGQYKYHSSFFLEKVPCKAVPESFMELFI